ncbi:MAG: HAD family hydrolase [Brevinematia bacterium]
MVEVKGFIFDLDGTLLDTLDDIVDAGNNVLRKLGIAFVEKEKFREFIGDGVRELFRRLLEYRGGFSDEKLLLAISMMKEEYSKNYLNKTKPYDGVYETLVFLKERGFKLSVLSNKQHFFTKELVSHFFRGIDFVSVIGIENPDDRKPNPRLAVEIAKIMNLEPREIFLVGDSATDILTAKNAGMRSVGVTWGFKTENEIISANPDYIVHTPKEISKIVCSDTFN